MDWLVLCGLGMILLYMIKKLYGTSDLKLPGPFAFPIFGNAFQVNLKAPHLSFTEFAEVYGAVFKVNMISQEIVIVNGFKAIKHVLSERGREFDGRPNLFRIQQYARRSGFGFSQPNTAYKMIRKATFRGIRSYGKGIPRMNAILSEICHNTVKEFSQTCGVPFDPWQLLYQKMLRSTIAFTVGENAEPSGEMYSVIKEMDSLAVEILVPGGKGAEIDVFPWLRYFGHPTWRKIQRLNHLRDQVFKMVLNMQKDTLGEEPSSVFQFYWLAKKENAAITDDRVKVAIGDMMIAGTMTTTTSTYALLNILVHHPHVQVALQQEIDEVLGNCSVPSLDDMNSMPYMFATILELNRYVTVTPLGLPHATLNEETKLHGYSLPRGSLILANMWGVHYDKEFWGDPEVFRPERFLDADGQLVPADDERRQHVIAFGMGPRLCPGENFAMGRIFMFCSSLLKQFTLHKDPSVKIQPSCEPWTFNLTLSIVPNKYRVLLKRRRGIYHQEE